MDRSVPGSSTVRSEAAARSQAHDDRGCCCCCTFVVLAATTMLVATFGARRVRVTVTESSLASLDLVVTRNGTGTASSVSVAYNLSLTVQLRNRHWATWAELAAPLDAELRFAGRRFDGARLADRGTSVPPRGSEEFRVWAASSPAGVPLGGARAAAELVRERAKGVFQVELRIAGAVWYSPVHAAGQSSRLEATCPLKMLMPNAPRGRGAHIMVVLHKGVVRCY